MIAGILHQGSGIGNQLHRYVATRVLATDRGYTFGMVAPENFKASSFITLDMGEPVNCSWSVGAGGEVVPISSMASFKEKKILENGVDVRSFDPEWDFVKDNTIIDGEFQDERYFGHRIEEIRDWIQTEPLYMPNNMCVIGFRGGEFQSDPDLFLTREYWNTAMASIRKQRPDVRFIAVTDDPETARRILPEEVKITHDVGSDWRSVRSAPYLILANSSFYILPALLNNHAKAIIAPRYWARRNTQTWATPQNYYPKFTYV